tara:strand:+ start:263 stop:505 length:243 start_codon:yes stop_codon:yes gene_type:complete
MISERCRGANLINYLKQKNIEYSVEFTQILDKSAKNYYNWQGQFTFNGETFVGEHKSIRGLKILLFEENSDYIHQVLKSL